MAGEKNFQALVTLIRVTPGQEAESSISPVEAPEITPRAPHFHKHGIPFEKIDSLEKYET